jgi:hypothetical protein
VALAVALVVGGALIAVAVVAAGGKGGPDAGLKIERIGTVGGAGGPELVVYVQDRAKNTRASSRGKASVTLECTNKAGKVLLRVPESWPFGFPDGTYLDPHVHQAVDEDTAAKLVRCRLAGTDPLLKGKIGGPAVR